MASRVPVNPSRDFFFSASSPRLRGGDTGTTTQVFGVVIPLGFRAALIQGCGEEGTRTPDLLLAKQALYQLSYFPACNFVIANPQAVFNARTWIRTKDLSFIRAAL